MKIEDLRHFEVGGNLDYQDEVDLITRRDAAVRIIHRHLLNQSELEPDDRHQEFWDALLDLRNTLLPRTPVTPGRPS